MTPCATSDLARRHQGEGVRPASRATATATASRLKWTLSLAKSRARWVRSVFAEMDIVAAESRLLRPSTMSCSTMSWRPVKPASLLGRVAPLMSWATTSGYTLVGSHSSPRHTARMASTSTSAVLSTVTQPRAPACSIGKGSPPSATTRTRGWSGTVRTAAANPTPDASRAEPSRRPSPGPPRPPDGRRNEPDPARSRAPPSHNSLLHGSGRSKAPRDTLRPGAGAIHAHNTSFDLLGENAFKDYRLTWHKALAVHPDITWVPDHVQQPAPAPLGERSRAPPVPLRWRQHQDRLRRHRDDAVRHGHRRGGPPVRSRVRVQRRPGRQPGADVPGARHRHGLRRVRARAPAPRPSVREPESRALYNIR